MSIDPERNTASLKPVFEFEQPDGSSVSLDFSAACMLGDFAFNNIDAKEPKNLYFSYHTGTRTIVTLLLGYMARTKEVRTDVKHIIEELERLTATMEATDESESQFSDYELAVVNELATVAEFPDDVSLSANGRGEDSMNLHFSNESVTVAMQREWDDDETLEYSVVIPREQVWQFVTGMAWRSYADPGYGFPHRSRHSSETFQTLLANYANWLDTKQVE